MTHEQTPERLSALELFTRQNRVEAAGPRFAFTDLAVALAKVDAERAWLFQGAIEGAPLVVWTGPEKSSKSWTWIDASVAAITGGRWAGMFPCARPGPVIYADGENGDHEFARRLARICRGRGIDVANVIPDLHHLYGQGLVLEAGNPAAAWLLSEALRIRPSLVVVDPLRNHLTGDENVAKDIVEAMNVGASLRDASGAAIVLLHHLNRAGTASGSRALGARADLILEGSDGATPWYDARGRTLRRGDPIAQRFTLAVTHTDDENDSIATTRVSLRFAGEKPGPMLGKSEEKILEVLRQNAGPMSANEIKLASGVNGTETAKALRHLLDLKLVAKLDDRWIAAGGS